MALHKKSGQKSDPQVNKDFLVSFWLFFRTRKPYFGHQKYRHGTLFVQSRYRFSINVGLFINKRLLTVSWNFGECGMKPREIRIKPIRHIARYHR